MNAGFTFDIHQEVAVNFFYITRRDVEAVIFQPLPLPLTNNEKTTVDLSSTKLVICYNQKV